MSFGFGVDRAPPLQCPEQPSLGRQVLSGCPTGVCDREAGGGLGPVAQRTDTPLGMPASYIRLPASPPVCSALGIQPRAHVPGGHGCHQFILQMTVTVGIGSGRGREPGTSSTSPTWVPGAHLSLLSSQEAESPGGQPGSDLALCSEMAAFVGSGLGHCAPMLPPYIHSHLLQGELVGTG